MHDENNMPDASRLTQWNRADARLNWEGNLQERRIKEKERNGIGENREEVCFIGGCQIDAVAYTVKQKFR